MSSKFVVLIVVSILSSIFIWYFWGDSTEDLLSGNDSTLNQEESPFAIAHNAKSQYFDAAGQLSYTFTADKLAHYRPGNTNDLKTLESNIVDASYTLIDNPNISMYRKNAPWLVAAKKGTIQNTKDTIVLEDDVTIRSQNINEKEVMLTTDQLYIYPEARKAETGSPVTIRSESGIIRAVGMQADIDAKKIKLLSNVRGEHDPFKIKNIKP